MTLILPPLCFLYYCFRFKRLFVTIILCIVCEYISGSKNKKHFRAVLSHKYALEAMLLGLYSATAASVFLILILLFVVEANIGIFVTFM